MNVSVLAMSLAEQLRLADADVHIERILYAS